MSLLSCKQLSHGMIIPSVLGGGTNRPSKAEEYASSPVVRRVTEEGIDETPNFKLQASSSALGWDRWEGNHDLYQGDIALCVTCDC